MFENGEPNQIAGFGSAARHAHARTGRPDIDDANRYKIT